MYLECLQDNRAGLGATSAPRRCRKRSWASLRCNAASNAVSAHVQQCDNTMDVPSTAQFAAHCQGSSHARAAEGDRAIMLQQGKVCLMLQ